MTAFSKAGAEARNGTICATRTSESKDVVTESPVPIAISNGHKTPKAQTRLIFKLLQKHTHIMRNRNFLSNLPHVAIYDFVTVFYAVFFQKRI